MKHPEVSGEKFKAASQVISPTFAHAYLGLVRRKLFRMSIPARRLTASWRKLPDFIIAGAQKAGSTYLFEVLSQQDEIWGPPIKELHYHDLHPHRGVGWYRAHFEFLRSPRMQIEASPFYMLHPHAPARMAKTTPGARVIVVLRDPVARALSHFNHNRRKGREPLSFRDALAAETSRIADQAGAIRTNPTAASDRFRHFSYRLRGEYALQVAALIAAFPPEKVLAVDSDLLFAHDTQELTRLEEFVGLKIDLSKAGRARKNSGGGYLDMEPGLHADLRSHYARFDAQLAVPAKLNQSRIQ